MIKNYNDLLNLDATEAKSLFEKSDYPWEVLPKIKEFILSLGPTLGDDYEEIKESVWIHKTAVLAPSASINAPCIIGENTEVRHCAFIRGSVLIGNSYVIGNSTEIKNAIILIRFC